MVLQLKTASEGAGERPANRFQTCMGKELVRPPGRSVGIYQSLRQPVKQVDRLSVNQTIILLFSDAVRVVDNLPMRYL
jgi:hypothetical protein